MRTLGVLGGMSPASTSIYYQEINRQVNQTLGGNASAPLLIASVDFEQIADWQRQGDWAAAGEFLGKQAAAMQSIGAQGILLATNTMHKVAGAICDAITVPFLHIVDVTAEAILAKNLTKVALLGTAFTMNEPFYRQRLAAYGIELVVPDAADGQLVHRVIFDELTVGKVCHHSKQQFLDIIDKLQQQGAQGVILGCTEIGLLICQDDTLLPVFDSALIHAQAAAAFILADCGE